MHARREKALSPKLATWLVSARIPSFGLISVGVIPAVFAVVSQNSSLPRAANRAIVWSVGTIFVGLLLGAALDAGQGTGRWTSDTWAVGLWIASLPLLAAAIYLAWMRPGARRTLMLAMAVAIGANALYFPMDDNPWKRAIGYSCSVLILIAAPTKSTTSQVLALASVASLAMYYDTRSLALAAVLAIGTLLVSRRRQGRIRSALRIAVAGNAFLIVAAWSLQAGWLGEEQRDLYVDQTSDATNLVAGARVESVITLGLAQERPLGFGLGAQIAPGMRASMIDRVRMQGGDFTSEYFTTSVLASRVDLHSTAANLWFHGGLVGLGLAIAIGWWIAKAIASLSHLAPGWQAPSAFILWMGAWDLLFSPMQQSDRLALALACAWFIHHEIKAEERSVVQSSPRPRNHNSSPFQ